MSERKLRPLERGEEGRGSRRGRGGEGEKEEGGGREGVRRGGWYKPGEGALLCGFRGES